MALKEESRLRRRIYLMMERVYKLGNFFLRISCEDAQVFFSLGSSLQTFLHLEISPLRPDNQPGQLQIISVPPPLPNAAEPLLREDGFELWLTLNGYYLICGSSVLDLDAQCSKGLGYFNRDFWQQPLFEQRRFIVLLFAVLLYNQGGYLLHANGIAWENNDGLLVVGSSGSGKSTLTLGLIQAGACCLGDDVLLLSLEEKLTQAYAMRRGFGCTLETAVQFPSLAEPLAIAPSLSNHKKLLDLETIQPGCFTPRCTPRLIVFPEVTYALHSYLLPLSPTQTLCNLMEQSLSVLMDSSVTRQQITMLSQLTQQARSYRLYAGRDVYTEPERVASLLQGAMQAK